MQTRSRKIIQDSAFQDLLLVDYSRRSTKKRKTLVVEETLTEPHPPVLNFAEDEHEPQDEMDASLSLKPSAILSTHPSIQDAVIPAVPVTSYQEKFGLFVQCFLKVQDEYNSIIDLINKTADRAEELKTRVNNLSFYFNYSSSAADEEDVFQKKRRRDRVLYELRDIQTLSSSMQNDYSCLKHRLKFKYLVVLDEFCTSFKEWEEKHSVGNADGSAANAANTTV